MTGVILNAGLFNILYNFSKLEMLMFINSPPPLERITL